MMQSINVSRLPLSQILLKNTQKIIDSNQSRCTILKMNPVNKKFLTDILDNIVKIEKLTITDSAKDFILHTCNNSIRLLINYMEKFKFLVCQLQ